MSDNVINLTCDLCSKSFKMGPILYQGKFLPTYGANICNRCYQGNTDGWAPHLENKIIAIAKSNGLAIPERNEVGLLPNGLS
ncbi:hypothetical protein [Rheinheimera texasensis]|uniref:hypothetical protein n=1 Tax=Rheinheimera texasensis TaxID=306205 RepID=UPI0032B1FA59